jgi:bile acid-coenzyme A ligase
VIHSAVIDSAVTDSAVTGSAVTDSARPAPSAAPAARVGLVRLIADRAAAQPDAPALTVPTRRGVTTVTYRELDEHANHAAHVLAGHGLAPGDVLAIALPNGIPHVAATLAGWKVGATVVPLDPGSPAAEARRMLAAAAPRLAVADRDLDAPCPTVSSAVCEGRRAAAPPDPGVPPRSALATGGTTGRPRVILRRKAWTYDARQLPSEHERAVGYDAGQVQLVTMPLFHGGFSAVNHGLALGHHIVLTRMFDPRLVAECLESHRVNLVSLVPTMMRLLLEPGCAPGRDLSALRAVHHGTAPCPEPVKRAWLDLVGPQHVFEGYGSQEQLGFVWIRGDDWLAHPGSVGRPAPGAAAIIGEDGCELPVGAVGEVYLRVAQGAQPEYLGDGPRLRSWAEDFLTVGDCGRLDAEGYLYITGRADQTINVGGAKVHPPEVESVLLAFPGVLDACVVGREHPVQGHVPHAFVVSALPGLDVDALDAHCRRALAVHKVPEAYELVDALPRTEAGKLRRSRLDAHGASA